ncbi:MAG: glycosyl transferase family 2 [Leptolyngbya foveolarum]|uniref:Glycosyl transferase family 2 n=1 Tax=Leptolyngbya foveolarum TaxID=47253 RepID=A0A2W4W431_9CYAN|nr:MAG: glycosyl transferase family 2 [Leptolyngbya foveolarum]
MSPLVSILIPVYNAEPWVAETIQSVIAQTWKNIEIVIVDDGSVDRSLEIARKFQSSTVKVIGQENQGASAARNHALNLAQGDFIQYLDADDLLAPEKVERQMRLLHQQSDTRQLISGEWARFYKSPGEASFTPQPLWTDMEPVDWLVCAWRNHWMMHPAAWLVPREIVQKAGEWNETLSLNDDGEYFCRIILASAGVKFCQGAKVYYRSGNSSSLSALVSERARESQFFSLSLGTAALLEKEESDLTRQVCATVFQRFIYEVYPQVPELCQKAEERVRQLGGSSLQPTGGPTFHGMSKLLGWQRTKQIQNWAYGLGYGQAALGWKLHQLKERMHNV